MCGENYDERPIIDMLYVIKGKINKGKPIIINHPKVASSETLVALGKMTDSMVSKGAVVIAYPMRIFKSRLRLLKSSA